MARGYYLNDNNNFDLSLVLFADSCEPVYFGHNQFSALEVNLDHIILGNFIYDFGGRLYLFDILTSVSPFADFFGENRVF